MWLINAYGSILARSRSHFLTSGLLGLFPSILLLVVTWALTRNLPLTPGQLFMLGWLSFAPFLVWRADSALDALINDVGNRHGEEVKNVLESARSELRSGRQWLFSLPWALTIGALATLPLQLSPLSLQSFIVFVIFLFTFLISGIGFNGVLAVFGMFQKLRDAEFRIEPYSADGVGGLEPFTRISMLATVLFSTGALAFPLAYEIAQVTGDSNEIRYVVVMLAGIYIAAILTIFLGPMVSLKEIISSAKRALIERSNKQMESIYEKAETKHPEVARAAFEQVRTYHAVFHSRLEGIKDYPYDIRILIELIISLAIPILVAIFQHEFLAM